MGGWRSRKRDGRAQLALGTKRSEPPSRGAACARDSHSSARFSHPTRPRDRATSTGERMEPTLRQSDIVELLSLNCQIQARGYNSQHILELCTTVNRGARWLSAPVRGNPASALQMMQVTMPSQKRLVIAHISPQRHRENTKMSYLGVLRAPVVKKRSPRTDICILVSNHQKSAT